MRRSRRVNEQIEKLIVQMTIAKFMVHSLAIETGCADKIASGLRELAISLDLHDLTEPSPLESDLISDWFFADTTRAKFADAVREEAALLEHGHPNTAGFQDAPE